MAFNIILTIIGLIVGWGIAHFYYAKSIKDLKAESEQRRRVEQLILRGIESVGTIKYNRDAAGNVSGVEILLKANVRATSSTPQIKIELDAPGH
jgi:hypothetical protein